MTAVELRGGPLDGRTVDTYDNLLVQLPGEQRHYVTSHWYGLDGRYLGVSRGRRRTLWVRISEWWAGL